MDSLISTVDGLKRDKETLKKDNCELRTQLNSMQSNLDQVESQSRRNNLRLNGISGNLREKWDVTEAKLRECISNDLGFGDSANDIEIDRAHRLKSKNPNMLL